MIKYRRIRQTGQVAHMREKKNAHRDFVGKPQGKKPVARHTRDK
jgi:hypothetical protein